MTHRHGIVQIKNEIRHCFGYEGITGIIGIGFRHVVVSCVRRGSWSVCVMSIRGWLIFFLLRSQSSNVLSRNTIRDRVKVKNDRYVFVSPVDSDLFRVLV